MKSLRVLAMHRPDLLDAFVEGATTALAGATLRWPETAALVDRLLPRIVGAPRHDVAIAVAATGLQEGAPFSFRPAPVAA